MFLLPAVSVDRSLTTRIRRVRGRANIGSDEWPCSFHPNHSPNQWRPLVPNPPPSSPHPISTSCPLSSPLDPDPNPTQARSAVAAATTPTQSAAAAATCGRLSSAAATRVAGLKTLAAAFASSSLFSSRRSWSGGAQGARAPPCVPGSMETSRSGARLQLCPDPDPGQPGKPHGLLYWSRPTPMSSVG